MRQQQLNKEPFIHFGFNKQSLNASVGEEVIIWQDRIYNADIYNISINSTGASQVSSTLNKFVLTYTMAGTYNVTFTAVLKDKAKNLESNTITVIVT